MSLELAAWGLVLLALAATGATVSLIRGAQRERAVALTERATAAVILTIAADCVAVLCLAFVTHVKLSVDVVTVIIMGGFACLSVPQLIWYGLYRRGRFR